MARIPGFTDEAWEAVQKAKAVLMAEGGEVVTPRHLFQGLVLTASSLVRAALASIGLGEEEVEDYIRRVSPRTPLPDPSTASKPLSPEAESVLWRARELAGPDLPVAPVHLWASVCSSWSDLKGWLTELGWEGAHADGLSRAVRLQLPSGRASPGRTPFSPRELEVLNNFCDRNLTELARRGELEPAYCMEHVTRQIVRCLLKRDRRNVIITGPAGVGKTKLGEDLAVRIVRGEFPELQGCEMFSFDLTLFTRGTHLAGSRAERWARLKEVLQAHPDDLILFMDEVHSVVGLPLEGQAMDLVTALKPLLAERGARIVGTTTPEDYRRYIQGDPALERRFTEVKVQEPDRDTTLRVLREVSPKYEKAHNVEYTQEALEAIYELARLYMPNRAFPAKAIDLMDEVGATVKVERRGEGRTSVGREHVEEALERLWGVGPENLTAKLPDLLAERVVGQSHAARELADIVITSAWRYGRERRRGPRAVILFVGPPGVGKSYMAQVLAEVLFPGQDKLLTLDMTEFSGYHDGEHARFRLLGPPPPYVGWENGGLLTEHALKNPVSVVLVDEFEKAGEAARNVLLRIFDEGWAQDGRGRVVSFREMYFILTANAGHELWDRMQRAVGFRPYEDPESQEEGVPKEKIEEVLRKEGFSPELLSRLSHIVLFRELTKEHLERIARNMLRSLSEDALIEDFVLLHYDEDALARWLVERCGPQGDCRRLRTAFESLVETPLSYWRSRQRAASGRALELRPAEDHLELLPLEGERFLQLLFTRVSEAFAERERRRRMEDAARLLLRT